MKRVLFLYQDDNLPSSRIRILNLLPELHRYGIAAEARRQPANLAEKAKTFNDVLRFDIVYLQKKLISPPEMRLYRGLSKRLVFDFDDAVYIRDDTHASPESASRRLKFRYIVKKADWVVAGNRTLSDYAKTFNNNTFILPSAVETRSIPVKDFRTRGEKLIIGWVGGKGNLHHLNLIAPVLRELSLKYPLQLNIISNGSLVISGVDVRNISWSLDGQEREIAHFDMGVMPLPKNRWTEGKCAYKALQYMAAEVPPVCSDVGANRDIVENGRDGFVVSSQEEFHHALSLLAEDGKMREEMGHAARLKVEKYFSVEAVARELARFLNMI